MKTIVIVAIVAILVIALVVLLVSLHGNKKIKTSVQDVKLPIEEATPVNQPYYRTKDGAEYPVHCSDNGAFFIQKYSKKGILYNMYIKKDRKQFIYYK